jgi:hypothetical protein
VLNNGWYGSSDMILLDAATRSAPDGALVEVGVYRGRSAQVINDARAGRPLYLFDNCTLEGVSAYDWPRGARITHNLIDPRDIKWNLPTALLHHDADHSQELVLSHLKWFGPWIMPGGIIVLHDYFGAGYPGVAEAWKAWADNEKYEVFLQGELSVAWRKCD